MSRFNALGRCPIGLIPELRGFGEFGGFGGFGGNRNNCVFFEEFGFVNTWGVE